jgi:RNA methyltransferase, TrmH family
MADLISSKSNKQIKAVRALKSARARASTGLFFAEGLLTIIEAAETGAAIEALVAAPGRLRSERAWQLLEAQRRSGVPRLLVTPEVFDSVSYRHEGQGIGAVIGQHWDKLPDRTDGLWVAVTEVKHPGNLGTIIRTADASGAAGVILIGPTTDPYHPVAVRGSMGALFSQCLVRSDFGAFLAWARRTGCRVLGTSPAAATDYRDCVYSRPLVVLMGSERVGLPDERQSACHDVVRIPMLGRGESLNLAVATALVLFEAARQGERRGQR